MRFAPVTLTLMLGLSLAGCGETTASLFQSTLPLSVSLASATRRFSSVER